MADQAASSPTLMSTLAKAGQGRIIAGLVVAALVGGVFAAMMLRTASPQMALLYSGLDVTEASEIAGRLDSANIKYDMRGDGSSVFVKRDAVMDARLMLSAEGLPTRGSVGYELFDKQDALGATTFIQNVNRVRALEGELARTISSLSNVRSARVHLVLPERRLFERDDRAPTASIVVDVVGRTLTSGQIRAIRNLASGAVPELKPDMVTLLDAEGQLLASGTGENGAIGGVSPDERRSLVEEEMRQKILAQLEPLVGRGNARVQVSADIDFNRITRQSETFDPDSRVVRSTQTVEETNSERSADGADAVSVDQNLPAADAPPGTAAPVDASQSERLEETVNYEISRTTQTEVIEGGTVRQLSIAVAVDHSRSEGVPAAEGEVAPVNYAPRSAEELAQITSLVRSAVGFSPERGDQIEVVNMRFADPDMPLEPFAEASFFDFSRNDLMRGGELLVLLIGGLAVIFFVLRPLVAGLVSPGGQASGTSSTGKTVNISDATGKLTGEQQIEIEEREAIKMKRSELEDRVDVANVSGQVKASAMKRIAGLVEEHPEESVSILRAWINEREASAA